jgi:hypothetical protein
MLAVAARAIAGPRITWVQCRAGNVDRHVTGPVDAVVCNSAIWQADLAATAAAVRNLLVTGGRFVFNTGCLHRAGESAPCFGGEPKHGTRTVLRVADEFPRRRTPGPWFMIVNS